MHDILQKLEDPISTRCERFSLRSNRFRDALRPASVSPSHNQTVGTVLLLVLALSMACVQVEPRFPRNAPPSRTSGYVGGVFSKDTVVGFGFRLQNEQTNQAYVLEVEEKVVSLIAVPPGRYRVASWLTWAALTGERLTEQAIHASHSFGRSFDVKAGQVVLLGSWFADRGSFLSSVFTLVSNRITHAEAVGAFRLAYPRFVNEPVQCLHCVP